MERPLVVALVEELLSLLSVCANALLAISALLHFFSVAGGGGTGSAAIGGWTLGKEAGSGTSATVGKLLAA